MDTEACRGGIRARRQTKFVERGDCLGATLGSKHRRFSWNRGRWVVYDVGVPGRALRQSTPKGGNSMTKLSDKVIAVTGAGSGIGRALALELTRLGARVALSDVNEEGLRETVAALDSGATSTTHVVDVRNREAVFAWAEQVTSEHGGVDGIINNAGLTHLGSVEDVSYEIFERVIDVNMWGVIHGVKAFLPQLRSRGAGHIVNISSINGMVPFANNGPYNISKYAVLGLSETLMQELAGEPIHVTSVHPGGIRTNIVRNASGAGAKDAAFFDKIAWTSAQGAAKVIVRGMIKKKKRVYIGLDAKFLAMSKRMFPQSTVAIVGAASSRATLL